MASKPNPQNSKGERFLGCPEYSNCLDIAAKRDWEDFTCEKCDRFYELKNRFTKGKSPKNLSSLKGIKYNCVNFGMCLFIEANIIEKVPCDHCKKYQEDHMSVKYGKEFLDMIGIKTDKFNGRCIDFGLCYCKALCDLKKIDCCGCNAFRNGE